MWSDDTFDAIKLTGVHLSFPEDSPVDYKVIFNHPSPKQSNLKEIHLLRVLLFKQIDMEGCAKADKEPQAKFSKYKGDKEQIDSSYVMRME